MTDSHQTCGCSDESLASEEFVMFIENAPWVIRVDCISTDPQQFKLTAPPLPHPCAPPPPPSTNTSDDVWAIFTRNHRANKPEDSWEERYTLDRHYPEGAPEAPGMVAYSMLGEQVKVGLMDELVDLAKKKEASSAATAAAAVGSAQG